MKITVVGCGRWGSLIAWYLDKINHNITLYGRKESKHMMRFINERKNDLLTLNETVSLSTELNVLEKSEVIIISINSQGLQSFMDEIKYHLKANHEQKYEYSSTSQDSINKRIKEIDSMIANGYKRMLKNADDSEDELWNTTYRQLNAEKTELRMRQCLATCGLFR